MTLTKAELADLLFEKVGLNKREAKDMVEAFFEEIRGALERGESVKLSGFGNFQLRDKPQRPGRNPKTGEEIPISARRVVTFHASQKLKAMVEKARHGAKPSQHDRSRVIRRIAKRHHCNFDYSRNGEARPDDVSLWRREDVMLVPTMPA